MRFSDLRPRAKIAIIRSRNGNHSVRKNPTTGGVRTGARDIHSHETAVALLHDQWLPGAIPSLKAL